MDFNKTPLTINTKITNKEFQQMYNSGTIYNNIVNKPILNVYNIITDNVNMCSRMIGESSREAYERNMLESISKLTTNLNNIFSIVTRVRYDKKLKQTMVYLSNVYWNDLYLTNHLVLPFNEALLKNTRMGKVETGMRFIFDGEIYSYKSKTKLAYMKYGIEPKCVELLPKTINELILKPKFTEFSSDVDYNAIDERFLQYVAMRIQYVTLVKTEYPPSYFLSMVCNMHFAQNYEKVLLVRQNDYNFLKENITSVIRPLLATCYMLDCCGFIDPYTIMSFLVSLYYRNRKELAKVISQETLIEQSDITNYISMLNSDNIEITNLDEMFLDSIRYINWLINKVISEQQIINVEETKDRLK